MNIGADPPELDAGELTALEFDLELRDVWEVIGERRALGVWSDDDVQTVAHLVRYAFGRGQQGVACQLNALFGTSS
jgi:hypothetical protein